MAVPTNKQVIIIILHFFFRSQTGIDREWLWDLRRNVMRKKAYAICSKFDFDDDLRKMLTNNEV